MPPGFGSPGPGFGGFGFQRAQPRLDFSQVLGAPPSTPLPPFNFGSYPTPGTSGPGAPTPAAPFTPAALAVDPGAGCYADTTSPEPDTSLPKRYPSCSVRCAARTVTRYGLP